MKIILATRWGSAYTLRLQYCASLNFAPGLENFFSVGAYVDDLWTTKGRSGVARNEGERIIMWRNLCGCPSAEKMYYLNTPYMEYYDNTGYAR